MHGASRRVGPGCLCSSGGAERDVDGIAPMGARTCPWTCR
jgi:hypothetical protein